MRRTDDDDLIVMDLAFVWALLRLCNARNFWMHDDYTKGHDIYVFGKGCQALPRHGLTIFRVDARW